MLDIDSDVYPELHARLSAIRVSGGRGECLRQLAASGLVWEALRLKGHGPATAMQSPAEEQPLDTARPAPSAPAIPFVPAAIAAAQPEKAANRGSAARRSPAVVAPQAPPPPEDSGFVNLAIDADTPPWQDPPSHAHHHHEAQPGAKRLPVLQDIVEPENVHAEVRARPARRAKDKTRPAAASGAPSAAEPASARQLAAEPDENDETSVVSAEVSLSWGAAPTPPASRARLRRMKELGLFKNG